MADGAPPPLELHARHDPLLVAAAADRGPAPATAQALLAGCLDCARLHADLRAIAGFVPTTSVPERPRDFTLTASDALGLRRRGLRAWFATIGSARDAVTRPLAASFTTLGLAGLLLTAAPAAMPMAGSAAASPDAAAVPRQTVIEAAPGDGGPAGGAGPAGGRDSASTMALQPDHDPLDEPGPSPLVLLSTWFLALGAGLFGVRRVAVRYGMR